MTKNTAVAKKTDNSIILTNGNELTFEDLKNQYAPGATDKEFSLFVNACVNHKLNPVLREVYFVKYGSAPGAVVIGYEVYLKRAERTGKLNGWDVNIAEKDGRPVEAVITIYRKDWEKPFIWKVANNEFNTGKSSWAKMPGFMLKKVAMAQGFRLAFPDELGGMPYIPEELPQVSDDTESLPKDVNSEVEIVPPKKITKRKIQKTKKKEEPKEEPSEPPVTAAEQEAKAAVKEEQPEEVEAEEVPANVSTSNAELVPDETRSLMIKAFGDLGVDEDALTEILGTSDWTMDHRNWLIDKYEQIKNTKTLEVKDLIDLRF